jgi:hypothetical protein
MTAASNTINRSRGLGALLVAFVLVFGGVTDGRAQQSPNPFLLDHQAKEVTIPEHEPDAEPEATPDVTVQVHAQDTLARVSRYLYGNNINPYIGDIHQEDTLIEHVTRLSPNVIRLPGGNLSNTFFWDASPGTLPPGVPDSLVDGNSGEKYEMSPWYGRDHWSLAIDGFYEFIEKTNATPIISVNYSYARYGKTENPVQQAAHYAAEWVRYDDGRTKFWEIGNENYGTWQAGYLIDTTSNQDGQPRRITGGVYGRHAEVFIDSMRAAAEDVGTEIYIGTQVQMKPPTSYATSVVENWNETYFEEVTNSADFFVHHDYFTDFETDSPPSHIFNSVDRQFSAVEDYYPEQIQAHGGAAKPIAMTEWNIFSEGSRQQVSNVSGLHAAMVLGRMAETPSFGLGARWNVGNGYSGGADHGMFKVEAQSEPPVGVPQWNPRPDYFHMYYFQRVFGDHSVQTEVEGSGVHAYGSVFSSGEAGVVVVNTSTSPQVVEIVPEDYGVGDHYYFYSLVGGEDNPPFSGRVRVNGREPDYDRGGPISALGSIPARSAPTLDGIRFRAPARSAQYVILGHTPGGTIGTTEPPPSEFSLGKNAPNPVSGETQIEYDLKTSVPVTLRIYDVLGREVTTLVNRRQPADDYHVAWDGTDAQGRPVSSGVYFYRLEAGSYSKTRKMVVVR